MAQERKFKKNLLTGSAAEVRQKVSVAIKSTSSLNRPKLIEPLDYENVIVKNRTILQNDPQREMLLYPHDDVSQNSIPRRFRTVRCSVPPSAISEATSLLVKECIKTYMLSWHVVQYKYSAFSGGYLDLQNVPRITLPEQVFEVDAEDERGEEERGRLALHITRQGWLYKGPDNGGSESGFISFTRSFKRRYFYLKQQADTTYVLEFHKDDKKLEAKGSIFLDSAVSVAKSSKRGKHAFELNMQDKNFFVFAADTEQELEGWVQNLTKVLQANEPGPQFERGLGRDDSFGRSDFRESLEHSMNPQLQKYARETDSMLSSSRRELRQRLFSLYMERQSASSSTGAAETPAESELYKEQFGTRLIVGCEHFKTRLQANTVDDGGEVLSNPEPFFISLALYDAKEGKKISEDFHFDPNSPELRGMIPSMANGEQDMRERRTSVDPNWMAYPSMAVFSVTAPHPDIYLVARIDKVLQGAIPQATEPYLKTPDARQGTKIYRNVRTYCNKLGQYRMPFAWAARRVFRQRSDRDSIHSIHSVGFESDHRHEDRPVFKPFTVELDTYSDFAIYRAEGNKISEEELIRHVQDIRKPEKQSKWQTIFGSLKVNMYTFKQTIPNTVTSSLVPVTPYPSPPELQPTVEADEFVPADPRYAYPYTTYANTLYVYPRNLKYDSQKSFPKARNIACHVEVRNSDQEGAVPLRILRGRPGQPLFVTSATTTVLHHSSTPDFYEEVKVALPTQLNPMHHLLFTFHHVSCDLNKQASSKRASHSAETVVGYAWFPLLVNGRVNDGEQSIRVATHLPAGYLSYEQLGLGKGALGPDVRWVDGGRNIFKFNLRLVSTIYTKDQHLHNFFSHCEKLVDGHPSPAIDIETANRMKDSPSASSRRHEAPKPPTPLEKEMLTFVKSLHAVDAPTLMNFLPTLFNQLLRLLPNTGSKEVAENAIRVLIHVVTAVTKANRTELLNTYVKYVFVTEPAGPKEKTIHEELACHLKAMLQPYNTDQLVVSKFMKHAGMFFDIIIKSMAQHLLSSGRIKMPWNERFPSNFQFHVQGLVQVLTTHIVQKYREELTEARSANISLAKFVKRCLTFMDRGFVFKLINNYMENFTPGDAKILHEFKFEFLRVVCEHEHFIPLNLPLMTSTNKSYKASTASPHFQRRHQMSLLANQLQDLKHDYTLSEEFRRKHFLVGLLLQETKAALNEIRDIRKVAIATLRNLLAKHSFDTRYSNKAQQSRIASLYLPFLAIILENKHRLSPNVPTPGSMHNGGGGGGTSTSDSTSLAASSRSDVPVRFGLGQFDSNVSLDRVTLTSATSVDGQSGSGRSGSVVGGASASGGALRYQKDPSVFAMIAGQGNNGKLSTLPDTLKGGSLGSSVDLNGSSETLHSSSSTSTIGDKESLKSSVHDRSPSVSNVSVGPGGQNSVPFTVRYDKLDSTEIRDLLTCFLYIVKNLAEDMLLGWFNNSSEFDVLDFFEVLEICMQQFKYQGRKRITSMCIISDHKRAFTLPANKRPPSYVFNRHNSSASDAGPELAASSEFDVGHAAQLEANLCTEVAMVVLDVTCLYTISFKDQLEFNAGDNAVMHKLFDLYLHFLATSQAEAVQKHAFAALRAFINKFPSVLFVGEATMCGRLCYEILRCCNSRLPATRSEACALIYLLMRSNFEYNKRKSFTRVHLQMIIAISQLISDVIGLSNTRFIDSLSVINSYTGSDKAIQKTAFVLEVRDLTKRMRTVLMATAAMKEHQNDPEMLVDLQYALAKSYASTPELRKTWLDAMARLHIKNENYSEAAHCMIHIAALVAEYLKRREISDKRSGRKKNRMKYKDEFPQGCDAFKGISPNVGLEESGMRDDAGMQDVQYTTDHLTELLEECARLLEKAERYELLGKLYRLIIPIYEEKRDFQRLANAYELLQRAYTKVVEVLKSGRRLLGKYFKVAFYGQDFFQDDHQKEYIYKEPKVTGLPEICARLQKLHGEKFGKDNVKLIMDSNKVAVSDLDPKLAYIQVTHVTPYFEPKELEDRRTDFEKNNNICRFSYETPFTKAGKARGDVAEQWKRRTILTTSHQFPYIKKRLLVVYHQDMELTPIECALDEMRGKLEELDDVVNHVTPDVKKLQLKLQGSVSVQVNAGPLAYAEAFLSPENIGKYDLTKVNTLKEHFRDFVAVCGLALDLNSRLIAADQYEYQEAMRTNFREMAARLSQLFGEQLLPDAESAPPSASGSRGSMSVFSVISSASSNA